MFSKRLDSLTLSSDLANQAFRKVLGDSFNDDSSFTATLRALLLPRIGDGDNVLMTVRTSTYTRSAITSSDTAAVFGATIGNICPNLLIIHNVGANNADDRAALFEYLDRDEDGFVKKYPDFHEMTNIREFVSEVMETRFYTSEEKRTTVIVVSQLNLKKWHYLQAFIPRYFKWYFQDKPFTEEEKTLLSSCFQRTSDKYEELIEKAADKFDLRSIFLKTMLEGFERRSREEQLDNIDRSIRECRQSIQRIMEQYQVYIDQIDEYNIRRLGIKEILNGAPAESELLEYFQVHKNIDLIEAASNHLKIVIRTYLDSFDPEMYATMSRRSASHLFRGYTVSNSDFTSERSRRRLLDAIFGDEPVLRVKICAYYDMDVRGDVDSMRRYRFQPNCNDYMPNPHLNHHNCLGNHRRYINDRLTEGDVVGAIEQCIASAKSLNLGEGATMEYFLHDLFQTSRKIIELPDHTSVNPSEALKWLKDQESKQKEESESGETD